MKTRIVPYIYSHALAIQGDDIEQGAALNQVTGPAFTVMTDEKDPKVLGCGGIRIQGLGEAWAMYDKEALTDFPKTLLGASQDALTEMIAEERLIRVFAEASGSEKWLEHLGFVKQDNIFVR